MLAQIAAQPAPSPTPAPAAVDPRVGRRLFESLRQGLPPTDPQARRLAVGAGRITQAMDDLLRDTAQAGGHATVLLGAYGQGKSFALHLLAQRALKAGFITLHAAMDHGPLHLAKPAAVYHDLLRSLVLPHEHGAGVRALARRLHAHLLPRDTAGDTADLAARLQRVLSAHLGCPPLAWLLSDPALADRPALLELLAGDPNTPLAAARAAHVQPDGADAWPDLAGPAAGAAVAFLLSGLGRLATLLGYSGVIVLLDEMEKWTDLDAGQQHAAGDWLGGLIWSATAPAGARSAAHRPAALAHGGDAPLATPQCCHVGVALGLTPRSGPGPEDDWSFYAPVEIVPLPDLDRGQVGELVERLAGEYAAAYDLSAPTEGMRRVIVRRALEAWAAQGQASTREAVQAVVASLDDWRGRQRGAARRRLPPGPVLDAAAYADDGPVQSGESAR